MNLRLADGLPNYKQCRSSWATTSFANARAAGILPIASSGNQGFPDAIASPACAPGAIRVGAVYDDDVGGRNWGSCTDATTTADRVTCFSSNGDFLTLLAPGAIIYAGRYIGAGTSAAAPHVAGGVAVLRDVFPDDSLQQTVDRMVRTGVPVTDANNQGRFPNITKPRLDLHAAISSADEAASTDADGMKNFIDYLRPVLDQRERFLETY